MAKACPPLPACSFRIAIRALLTAIGGLSGPAHQGWLG
jgi:hypothetical protein